MRSAVLPRRIELFVWILALLPLAGCFDSAETSQLSCTQDKYCPAGYVCLGIQPGLPGKCQRGNDSGPADTLVIADRASTVDTAALDVPAAAVDAPAGPDHDSLGDLGGNLVDLGAGAGGAAGMDVSRGGDGAGGSVDVGSSHDTSMSGGGGAIGAGGSVVDGADVQSGGGIVGGGGGSFGSGGATGGIVGSGGAVATGGANVTGGAISTGGIVGTGGVIGAGGVAGSGGAINTGGIIATGGIAGSTTATGGTTEAATISDLVAGRINTCMRKSDGSVWCWGEALHGLLGTATSSTAEPTRLASVVSSVYVAVGQYHACSLKNDGTVACWGYNDMGQVGNGSTGSTPVASAATVPSLSGVVSLGVGADTSCAVLNTGDVRCWGSNSWGGLATRDVADLTTTPVATSLGSVSAVAMHGNHSCALLNSGSVRCWGENLSGEIGAPVTSMSQSADPVYVPNITTAMAIAVGWSQSCALLANGTVWCWGSQSHGALGNATSDPNVVSPTPVQAAGISAATAIACGGLNCCALLTGGTLKCWGYNDFGQVGDGTTVDRSTPAAVLTGLGSPLTNVVDIAVGFYHSCALTSSKDVYCWGQSSNYANGATSTSTNLTYATRI
jgi:hypothetical protein